MADIKRIGSQFAAAMKAASEEAEAALAAQKAAKKAGKLEEVLASKTPPATTPHGTGLPLMPRSSGMYTPGVEQKNLSRMPKVDKARAAGKSPEYTPRMQDLLDSRAARKKVDALIEKGDELGMQEWYGTEPLHQVAMDIGMTQKGFEEFMGQMASASQRNPVDQQNKMGSYLWHLSQTGGLPEDAFLLTNAMKSGRKAMPEGTPIEMPPGLGSLAQSAIFERGKTIARGDIDLALPENAKLGTFHRNLLGNLQPVTVDVNAVRGPIIERGDPRWLTSKLTEKDPEGNVTGEYFPREDVKTGKLSMKEAKSRPGFWEAAPSGSEYAGFEELWQRAAKRKGVAPAEAQALGWYGSGDVTALKTKPELYIENLERLVRAEAERTGKNPRTVLEAVLRGETHLKKKGGAVTKIKAFDRDEDARRWKDEISAEVNKANGGEIRKLAWKPAEKMAEGGAIKSLQWKAAEKMAEGGAIKTLKWRGAPGMAQGGAPSLGPVTDNTVPDSGDSGAIRYAPSFEEGGGVEKAKLTAEILAKMAKEQAAKEGASLSKPGATRDLISRGVIAPLLGMPVDLANLGLEGVDYLREKATGKPIENRFGSDKPFLGSEHLKGLMREYGVTTENERPMMETALSLVSPVGAVKGVQGAAKAIPKATRAIEGGLNATTAAVARPFTPATITMEAVAPDLAKFKPREWQDTVTRRMMGEGSPVSMEVMGGKRTTKRPGQGSYLNLEGKLETNPLMAVDVPHAGSLSANAELRRDVAQAGVDLAQESVAAHRFLPIATNNIEDATAMLIKAKDGKLTDKDVIALGRQLPGMIVAHNPRLGGVVVLPFGEARGAEFLDAQTVAKTVLGKRAVFQYGKADPVKDRLYIERGDYATEGAGAPSANATEMRRRLKAAEARAFRDRVPHAVGSR